MTLSCATTISTYPLRSAETASPMVEKQSTCASSGATADSRFTSAFSAVVEA